MSDVEDGCAYRFGAFLLDVRERRLSRGSEVIPLRLKVFDTLRVLVENAGRLVTKQELLDAVWPGTAIEENNLNHNVSVLRKALGEKATGQQYIETVPRVGYRFVAPVELVAQPVGTPASADNGQGPVSDEEAELAGEGPTSIPSGRHWPAALALLAATIVIAVTTYGIFNSPEPGRVVPLTEKDSVLIADFVNTTGDQVFDGTLRHAVAVHLEQSPFLSIVSEERARGTLRYIGRPAHTRVTGDLAREIAQRIGATAVLRGSIAEFGSHYAIDLVVVSAASGETIAREQAEAERRETILGRLGEAATRLREKLGESLPSIERFSAPIEQATTASLDAFKAYDLGRQKHFDGQYFEAIPFYRRAVELDPDFAMAHAALGITYGTAREYELAAKYSQRAFQLRDRVSERERFYIAARYYVDVLHDTDRAIEVLELWKQTYPRDFAPRTNLSARYAAIGRYEDALREAQEGLRLNPDAGVAYAGVAHTEICLNRYPEAEAVIEQAFSREHDVPYGRYMLYAIAFVRGNAAEMQRQVAHASNTPVEGGMLALQSVIAAYRGRLKEAGGLATRAVDLERNRGLEEAAGVYAALEALWQAAYGNCRESEQATARALAVSRGRNPLSWSALSAAMCGHSTLARKLATEMAQRFPHDSFFKAVWLPMVDAALARRDGQAAAAVEHLKSAEQVEQGIDASLWPAYLRGLALLDQRAHGQARIEFQKVLDHKGVLVPKDFNPAALALYPLAQLGMARAAARDGDEQASRKAYEALLALWQEADADVRVIQAARREYRQLNANSKNP